MELEGEAVDVGFDVVDGTGQVGGDGTGLLRGNGAGLGGEGTRSIEGDCAGPGGGSRAGPLLQDAASGETDLELGELVVFSHSSTWIPLDLLTRGKFDPSPNF